jgi:Type III secretion system lipoprotein chaperone (YscW)
MSATRLAAACLCAIAVLAGCRRPQVEPKAELGGAWLREPDATRGFELRRDGSLALLGMPELGGLAWNASHGELVLSTNSAERVESALARLRVVSLGPDVLELAGEGQPLAGRYRRAQAAHVRGVVTYRERMALPPDARVVVVLTQIGVGPVATQAFLARSPVPIGFELSLLPEPDARYELTARIGDRERTLFATPEPVTATPDGPDLEVLLRSAR